MEFGWVGSGIILTLIFLIEPLALPERGEAGSDPSFDECV